MNCKRIQGKLSAYLDDELDATTKNLVAEHLQSCPGCRQLLTEWHSTYEWMVQNADPVPYFSVSGRVQQVLQDRPTGRHTFGWFQARKWLAPVTIATGLTIGILMGIQLDASLTDRAQTTPVQDAFVELEGMSTIPKEFLTFGYAALDEWEGGQNE